MKWEHHVLTGEDTLPKAALDRAVWDAYGWDDPDPAAVADDAILARLLALNGERGRATHHDPTEHSRRVIART